MFYHRCTNNTDFSRQACAEPIEILPDGSIPQVEITSQGLSGMPISAKGSIPVAIACNLTCGKPVRLGIGKQQALPRIDETEGEVYVADLVDNTQLGYKYFNYQCLRNIGVVYRGTGSGTLEVRIKENGDLLGTIPVYPSLRWTQANAEVKLDGVHPLFLCFRGTGKIDLCAISFSKEETV